MDHVRLEPGTPRAYGWAKFYNLNPADAIDLGVHLLLCGVELLISRINGAEKNVKSKGEIPYEGTAETEHQFGGLPAEFITPSPAACGSFCE